MDALKHPYFTTPPLPALPGEIPHFQDSHELDRKKFRGQRAPMPPAPAGGSVETSSNGGWASSGSRGMANSRIPGAARGGRPNVPGVAGNRRGPVLPSQRDNGLPPRPPVSAHQPRDVAQAGRVDARDDQRRDRHIQGRSIARYPSHVDSYVPSYGNPPDRSRSSAEYQSQSNVDWRGANRRDHRREVPRRRSRSPNLRHPSR